MTKDVGMAEAAAFAPAFIDKACFQACWVPVPSGRAWEREALLWQRKMKPSPSCANWICTCTCPRHKVGHATGDEGAGK